MIEHLRNELLFLLGNGGAHEGPRAILADYPVEAINTLPPNGDYSPWELLEHIRICQQEIIEQIEAEEMPTYNFPADFWPPKGTTASVSMWQSSVESFFADLAHFRHMAETADLAAMCRNNPEASVLHALFNIAAHNHYHLGEFAILRQTMGTWHSGHTSR